MRTARRPVCEQLARPAAQGLLGRSGRDRTEMPESPLDVLRTAQAFLAVVLVRRFSCADAPPVGGEQTRTTVGGAPQKFLRGRWHPSSAIAPITSAWIRSRADGV